MDSERHRLASEFDGHLVDHVVLNRRRLPAALALAQN
jgi:hypothetical protein